MNCGFLINKDCIEYLKTLETESVDLVLTDPPYFIGFDGGKGCDSQWKTEDEYLDWCKVWSVECARVLKTRQNDGGVGNFENRHFPQIQVEHTQRNSKSDRTE